jgi:hypothetical protein
MKVVLSPWSLESLKLSLLAYYFMGINRLFPSVEDNRPESETNPERTSDQPPEPVE